MRYEINVRKHGRHFFRAQLLADEDFVAVARTLMEKFPTREGYSVTAISVSPDTQGTQDGH